MYSDQRIFINVIMECYDNLGNNYKGCQLAKLVVHELPVIRASFGNLTKGSICYRADLDHASSYPNS